MRWKTAFEAQHPDVDVQVEGHGSIQAIRQVTDLHRPIDVVAVADESLIPDLMFRTDPATGTNFTDSVYAVCDECHGYRLYQ